MTPAGLGVWILVIAIASAGFISSLRRQRSLVFPISYLAYFAGAGLVQLLSKLIGSGQYDYFFWFCEILHNVLLFAVCLELAFRLFPREYAHVCSVSASLIVAISFMLRADPSVMENFLRVSLTASFTGGVLLCFAFFIKVRWTREYRLTTAGVMTLLVADLLLLFAVRDRLGSSLISQLGPIPGLVLLSVAGPSKKAGANPYRREMTEDDEADHDRFSHTETEVLSAR